MFPFSMNGNGVVNAVAFVMSLNAVVLIIRRRIPHSSRTSNITDVFLIYTLGTCPEKLDLRNGFRPAVLRIHAELLQMLPHVRSCQVFGKQVRRVLRPEDLPDLQLLGLHGRLEP
jgi:hypothetical protein